MARARNPNREKAYQLYKDSGGTIKPKKISKTLNENINNIRSWKSKDKWDDRLAEEKKGGAPIGNQNAKGHGAPKGNLNNLKHGNYIDNSRFESKSFLSKYVFKSTVNIIEEIEDGGLSSLEIIWTNITIQFAAIIRSQKIMYVKNKDDLTKELKRSKVQSKDRKTQKTESNSSVEEYEYEIQFAWDKQATFLNAQSRAMGELRNLIKQYEELLHKNWDLATEEQKLRIEKLKSEVNHLKNDEGSDSDLTIVVDYGD
jgi:uncharacterized protein YjcR